MPEDLMQHWNNYYDQGRDFMLISSLTMNRFLDFYPAEAPKTALDIGCGTGQLARELWHRGFKVTGVDVSKSAVKAASSLTTAPTSELFYKQMDIEKDDVADLPFQPYGLITCKLVYAFMRDKPAFLNKITQLLGNKGIFVVITPLLETTPSEKKGIAVSPEDIHVLRRHFDQIAWYEAHETGYFVGCAKA